ncbi:hypothetical protein [Streptomyces sp. NPDC086787]|uniref:hypothetical protein n=1 Tax=Streptomyces sp. NPDC086787 TaxID=3365759 RepID=UPI0037FE4129
MHAKTDTTTVVPRRKPAAPWMAAWTGEQFLKTPLVLQPDRSGIAYLDELSVDRGRHGVLLHRGRGWAAPDRRGRALYGEVHFGRQRRAMAKLLCHVCGGTADRSDVGVFWLLDNVPEKCPEGWPEEELTVHPPVCAPCAIRAIAECPELEEKGVTAVRVRDPQPYGYRGRLYTRDLTDPAPRIPILSKPAENLSLDSPLLPWLLAAQFIMCLVDCTVVSLKEECAVAGR